MCAQVLQLLAALSVLATGGVLFLFEQNQADAVNIIINSVALVFILEVDNRLGTILSLRGGLVGWLIGWLVKTLHHAMLEA